MAAPDRDLFEREAVTLYEGVLDAGSLARDDPSVVEGGPSRSALDLLLEMGLLAPDETGSRWVPVDPATVQAGIVGPLSQHGAELLSESAHWARTFTGLAQRWRRSPEAFRGPFIQVRGEAIDPYIAGIVVDAEFELLTAQPQTGRTASTLSAATRRDVTALGRGVKMRTLYQHAARRNSVTHKYVAAVTPHGAEVRTLDEFFNRLIVVDRRVAVIPGHEGLAVALVVREPSVVAYLVDMFDRTWERARPFTNKETSTVREVAAEQRAMTIRMLVEGRADSVSAKRVGVSPRTYAGYVADLKEEFDVDTRFQLGWTLGRRGISGQESDPPSGGSETEEPQG